MKMMRPVRPTKYIARSDTQHDEQRGSAAKRGYGRKWQQARLGFLQANPLCVACLARGEATQATVVDHIVPHRGDMELFWRDSNWQALCKPCHDKKTQLEKVERCLVSRS